MKMADDEKLSRKNTLRANIKKPATQVVGGKRTSNVIVHAIR
jgi:hypothetical protein